MLREDLSIVQGVLWMMDIVSVITEEDSVWKALYESGAFNDMEVLVLGNVEWSALSESMQKKAVSFSMSSLEIPAGIFMMGASEPGAYTENPQHEVILTKRILVSKYLCTQGLHQSVMSENPSHFKGSIRPVENVSWGDAVLQQTE